MSVPFFTAVIPLHNKAPHIERAIASVFAQTERDWELVLVDDASTDGGGEIAEGLLRQDPRCRILRRPAPGPGGYAARNLGARESRADWVAFLDADDEWSPGLLEEYRRLGGLFPDLGFLGTAHREVLLNGQLRLDPYVAARPASRPLRIDLFTYAREGASGRNPIRTSAVALRKELLFAVGAFPEGRCVRGGDRDTWLRLLVASDLAWSPYLGAVYHRDAVNQVTRTTPPEVRNCMDKTFAQILGDRSLSVRFPPGFRRALMRLSNHEKRGAVRIRMRAGALKPGDLRSFHFFADPLYCASVLAASFLPGALLRWIYAHRERALRGPD
jgi:succinoglycan biosynthesis protein ExoO